jgi:hypothetical protein
MMLPSTDHAAACVSTAHATATCIASQCSCLRASACMTVQHALEYSNCLSESPIVVLLYSVLRRQNLDGSGCNDIQQAMGPAFSLWQTMENDDMIGRALASNMFSRTCQT